MSYRSHHHGLTVQSSGSGFPDLTGLVVIGALTQLVWLPVLLADRFARPPAAPPPTLADLRGASTNLAAVPPRPDRLLSVRDPLLEPTTPFVHSVPPPHRLAQAPPQRITVNREKSRAQGRSPAPQRIVVRHAPSPTHDEVSTPALSGEDSVRRPSRELASEDTGLLRPFPESTTAAAAPAPPSSPAPSAAEAPAAESPAAAEAPSLSSGSEPMPSAQAPSL